MFWRNKWESLGVKKKIFITNTLLIGISFILLYSVIYVFMPKVYNTYKMNKIYANISELRTELSENEHIDLYEVLDDFSYNNNVSTLVLDENTENGMSNIDGIYPIGEGAGYSGGITTSAMDGIKISELIAKVYKN